jgi:hypothetical protein
MVIKNKVSGMRNNVFTEAIKIMIPVKDKTSWKELSLVVVVLET